MIDCKPADTPLNLSVKLSKDMLLTEEIDIEIMRNIPYQNTVKSLIYAMTGTRPDIAYAVGATSAYNSNPGEMHWKAVK
jgi:hypothetical protein